MMKAEYDGKETGRSEPQRDGTMLQLFVVLALAALAMLLVALAMFYRSSPPRPLPAGRPWLQWLPKYSFQVPLSAPLDHSEAVRAEIGDWLRPFGFDGSSETTTDAFWSEVTDEGQLVFDRSRFYELTNSCKLMRVVLDTPLANPCQVTVLYRGGVIVDTGDLAAFGKELQDKRESEEPGDSSAPVIRETGNPYQSPQTTQR